MRPTSSARSNSGWPWSTAPALVTVSPGERGEHGVGRGHELAEDQLAGAGLHAARVCTRSSSLVSSNCVAELRCRPAPPRSSSRRWGRDAGPPLGRGSWCRCRAEASFVRTECVPRERRAHPNDVSSTQSRFLPLSYVLGADPRLAAGPVMQVPTMICSSSGNSVAWPSFGWVCVSVRVSASCRVHSAFTAWRSSCARST